MLVSTTVLKFSPGTSNSGGVGLGQSMYTSNNGLSNNSLSWESDKFSPVKLESPDSNLDDILLNHSGSNDFAELKPLPYDDFTPSNGLSGGLDPVLSSHSNLNNNNMLGIKCLNTSIQFTPPNSQSDVTSSGSPTSPNIVPKIETLDFSKNDLDDLASIVGISIDADSTVPNGCSGDISDLGDLDWIDSIKPLNSDINFESLMSSGTQNMATSLILQRNSSIINAPVIGVNQPFFQMVPVGQTLHTLLQSSASHVSQQMPKITQLQQRPLQLLRQQTVSPQHPPPYSILQNRLQQGTLDVNQQQYSTLSQMIKVDSTYDMLKSQEDNMTNSGYHTSSFNSPDSLPHSTQTLSNQVNSTSDQGLQRRLNELGGLTKIKKKHNSNVRPKISGGLDGSSSNDSKKMMHHCQICSRGFLNKSNIKVHMRTHTGEKPFKCEHCSKAFRQKAHLLKHSSIHKRITRD